MFSKSEKRVKKLVSVLAVSTPVTETRKKAVETPKAVKTAEAGKNSKENKGIKNPTSNLAWIPCIWYPVIFRKKSVPVSALFDSGNKVNAIYPTFAKKLSLPIRPIDVEAKKIDSNMLDIFGIVVAVFSVMKKANQIRFFKETFLVANVNLKVVFGMSFLTLSSADIDFLGQKLWWRTYTIKKAPPTIRRIDLMGKKKFVAIMLDLEYEIYIVHVGSVSSVVLPNFSPLNADIHTSCRP